MSATIDVEAVEVYGGDTHARARSPKSWVLGRRERQVRVPILRGVTLQQFYSFLVSFIVMVAAWAGMAGSWHASVFARAGARYSLNPVYLLMRPDSEHRCCGRHFVYYL